MLVQRVEGGRVSGYWHFTLRELLDRGWKMLILGASDDRDIFTGSLGVDIGVSPGGCRPASCCNLIASTLDVGALTCCACTHTGAVASRGCARRALGSGGGRCGSVRVGPGRAGL